MLFAVLEMVEDDLLGRASRRQTREAPLASNRDFAVDTRPLMNAEESEKFLTC